MGRTTSLVDQDAVRFAVFFTFISYATLIPSVSSHVDVLFDEGCQSQDVAGAIGSTPREFTRVLSLRVIVKL